MKTPIDTSSPPADAGVSRFMIDAFLTYRIASYLTFRSTDGLQHRKESGPYGVFDKFRDAISMKFDERGAAWTAKQPNELAKLFTCMYCSTTWIGLVVAVLRGKGIGYALALSTAAIMIERYTIAG